jgi:hypothetical protein
MNRDECQGMAAARARQPSLRPRQAWLAKIGGARAGRDIGACSRKQKTFFTLSMAVSAVSGVSIVATAS